MSTGPRKSLRAAYTRQVILWHWVSSGVCLGGMLLFTVTGITLNHAADIAAKPQVSTRDAKAPAVVMEAMRAQTGQGRKALPEAILGWVASEFGGAGEASGEWSQDELYVSLPRPGGDAWLTIERKSGDAHYERTENGWVSYVNDLHKGRHTGKAWSVFIDVLAAACLVFSITGLLLLQTHAAKRPSTWPLVMAGVALPVIVLVAFVHR